MANLGNFRIETTADGWTNLTNLAGISSECTLQNTKNACKVCEKSTMPKQEGFVVPEGTIFQYTPSSTLWIKPYGVKNYVEINISS